MTNWTLRDQMISPRLHSMPATTFFMAAVGGGEDQTPLPGWVQYLGALVFVIVGLRLLVKPTAAASLATRTGRTPAAATPTPVGLFLARVVGLGLAAVGVSLFFL